MSEYRGVQTVSYFEHEFPDRVNETNDSFLANLQEIKQLGFNQLILCISEQTLENPLLLAQLRQRIQIMHDQSVRCIADPWGVGKVFGGEGKSFYARLNKIGCFCEQEFHAMFTRWIQTVKDIGVDGIMWDEPEIKCPDHSDVAFLDTYGQFSHQLGLYNMVCLTADWRRTELVDHLAAKPWVNNIGVDPYWPNAFKKIPKEERALYVKEWTQRVVAAATLNNKDHHLWIQGFGIYNDDLDMIEEFAGIMRTHGEENLAFWGYKGCETLFPDMNNPEFATSKEMWQKIGIVALAAAKVQELQDAA